MDQSGPHPAIYGRIRSRAIQEILKDKIQAPEMKR